MSDEYTAEAMADDILGSMRAFWEDFKDGAVVCSAYTGGAVVMVRSIEGEIFHIRVNKLTPRRVEDV